MTTPTTNASRFISWYQPRLRPAEPAIRSGADLGLHKPSMWQSRIGENTYTLMVNPARRNQAAFAALGRGESPRLWDSLEVVQLTHVSTPRTTRIHVRAAVPSESRQSKVIEFMLRGLAQNEGTHLSGRVSTFLHGSALMTMRGLRKPHIVPFGQIHPSETSDTLATWHPIDRGRAAYLASAGLFILPESVAHPTAKNRDAEARLVTLLASYREGTTPPVIASSQFSALATQVRNPGLRTTARLLHAEAYARAHSLDARIVARDSAVSFIERKKLFDAYDAAANAIAGHNASVHLDRERRALDRRVQLASFVADTRPQAHGDLAEKLADTFQIGAETAADRAQHVTDIATPQWQTGTLHFYHDNAFRALRVTGNTANATGLEYFFTGVHVVRQERTRRGSLKRTVLHGNYGLENAS